VPIDARWSSLAARRAHNPKVVGSNPALATIFFIDYIYVSVDARWSSLAARRAHNPKVVGSNPALATIFFLISTCRLMRGGAVWQLVGLITRRS
jgi:hypothetical protein